MAETNPTGQGNNQQEKVRFGESLKKKFEFLKIGGKRKLDKSPNQAEKTKGRNLRVPKLTGVITDQKLIQHFYGLHGEDVQPIATDRFLDRSRDQYNEAWLSRELVQNFVDHNPTETGTLNGVHITNTDIGRGKRRYVIEGDWPFKDITGLTAAHSDKPEGQNTAGGNGIGLKQTALRYLRDFGIKRFEIQGEGWTVNYRLAKAADINQQWQSGSDVVPIYDVQHDWLVADIRQTKPTGRNSYIIETDNLTVIGALNQLPTLGVSRENPYLQNVDFQNTHGAIKWLPISSKKSTLESFARNQSVSEGRLFINGQVMNYKQKGETGQDYWRGPEFVTIQLNNVKYDMSIDRPPITPSNLGLYLNELVSSMSKEEIIDQLHKSEHLWTQIPDTDYNFEKKGCFVVIEKLVGQLPWKGYNNAEFAQAFAGKKYVAHDRRLTDEDITYLHGEGYIICPQIFERIGMPKASSRLETTEAAKKEKPQLSSYRKEQIAQEYGMEVAYEDLSEVKDAGEFFRIMRDKLTDHVQLMESRNSNGNTIRIKLDVEIPNGLLSRALVIPKDETQKLLYFLRGVAQHGLDSNIFKDMIMSQGEYVTTFNIGEDEIEGKSLVARNIKNSSDQGVFLEFELSEQHLQLFKQNFGENLSKKITSKPLPETNKEVTQQPSNQDQPSIIQITDSDQQTQTDTDQAKLQQDKTQWTDAQISLLNEAHKKQSHERTEEEKTVVQEYQQWKKEFNAVPINQPQAPEVAGNGKVIEKTAKISEKEQTRVKQMENQLTGIVEAVNKLEELIPERTEEASPTKTPIEKYLDWRKSDQFYGQLANNAGYLSGKHLVELINEQNQAEIASVQVAREDKTPEEIIRSTLESKLKAIVKRMNAHEDDVDDFEIELTPSERQLGQLGLLRLYTQLTTEVMIPNDFFIYKGTGSKGINLGQKAIGMHESLFDVKFTETLRTFGHEVAHNYPEAADHGNKFRHAMESVFVTMIDKVSHIADKLYKGEQPTQQEQVILDIQNQWDKLLQVA